MSQRYIEVKCPVTEDDHHGHSRHYMQRHHSSYHEVAGYCVMDGVLAMTHDDGTKSFVVLGKGYSVTERVE